MGGHDRFLFGQSSSNYLGEVRQSLNMRSVQAGVVYTGTFSTLLMVVHFSHHDLRKVLPVDVYRH